MSTWRNAPLRSRISRSSKTAEARRFSIEIAWLMSFERSVTTSR
jgi:hypothetical protein